MSWELEMATTTMVKTGWAVRNGEGRVLVIFTGADAREAAADWAERGYEVSEVEV